MSDHPRRPYLDEVPSGSMRGPAQDNRSTPIHLRLRALRAYYSEPASLEAPVAAEESTVVRIEDHLYVRLADRHRRPVAIYRVHNNGALRRMRRPPKEVLQAA